MPTGDVFLCAIGYSGAKVDVSKISVSFSSSAGTVNVCKGGFGIPFSEEDAKKILSQPEININVELGDGLLLPKRGMRPDIRLC